MAKKRVLVQAGHLAPREPGFEGGTGTAGEIEVVTKIRNVLVSLLNKDGRFEAIPMPGHITPRGIRVDAALFLHCDGAGSPQASGYSFGYPNDATNIRLARLINEEFVKLLGHPPHHKDNYTPDLRGYYGYSRVNTPGPEVLVEHGFLTNPAERVWINQNIQELAEAEYKALLRYFGFAPPHKPPPPPPKPYRLQKIRKNGTAMFENVGKLGVLNAVQLFLRGQFKELHIKRR